ncbi:MAG: endolytic transglycosylase MltG [Bacilli bacterium]
MKKYKLNKKRLIISIILFVLIIICAILSFFFFMLSPVDSKGKYVEYFVKENSTPYEVIGELESKNIIRSSFFAKIYIKLTGDMKVYEGKYNLSSKDNTPKIINTLKKGVEEDKGEKITFKEGYNMRNFISLVTENTTIKEEDIKSTLKDNEYLKTLIDKYWFLTDDILNKDLFFSLEGYLFPDTYFFKKNATIKEVLTKMLDETESKLSAYKDKFTSNSLSIHDIITLASVVEKESAREEDRALVGAVFLNRIDKSMNLGSCVTTYYAVGKEMSDKVGLTQDDLNTKNPYNTRAPNFKGLLPVGPISNPGINSILAVINPTKTKYLYFVNDVYGKLYFTQSYAEHQAMINKLRKEGIYNG